MIPQLVFFPLALATFLIEEKGEKEELNCGNGEEIRAYITLEMRLLTPSDIEVQLAIKLNAVLNKQTIF